MKRNLQRALAAVAALMIAAPFGAHALVPPSPGADEPKDCKMKPEDPRCKDDKKG
jgi:hypothetical protein